MSHILRTLRERVKLNCSFGRDSSEQVRQKIASELLTALITNPQEFWDENTLFGDSKTVKSAVEVAVKLADLLLIELEKTSKK